MGIENSFFVIFKPRDLEDLLHFRIRCRDIQGKRRKEGLRRRKFKTQLLIAAGANTEINAIFGVENEYSRISPDFDFSLYLKCTFLESSDKTRDARDEKQ